MTQMNDSTMTTTSSPVAPSTTRLNGLSLAELQAAVEQLTRHPEASGATFRIAAAWGDGAQIESRVQDLDLGGQSIRREHVIRADEPKELLGTDGAPNPAELLLAAVASCMGVTYVVAACQLGVRIHRLEMDLSGTIDLRGAFGLDPEIPPGFTSVDMEVRIAHDGTPEQLAQIEQEVLATSPNHYHLTHAIPLRMQVRDLSS